MISKLIARIWLWYNAVCPTHESSQSAYCGICRERHCHMCYEIKRNARWKRESAAHERFSNRKKQMLAIWQGK